MLLRVISYNIHSGKDILWRKRLKEVTATLDELQADVICLQEIHQNKRMGYQVDYVGEMLAMKSVFSTSIPFAGGGYGNALFTKLPIEEVTAKKLPAKMEARSLLQVKLNNDGACCHIWSTHLSLDRKSRQMQMNYLSHELEIARTEPLLLLGDFNTRTLSLPPTLIDTGKAFGKALTPTVWIPPQRIDYILASGHWRITDYRVIDVRWSDHKPILATLALPGVTVLEE